MRQITVSLAALMLVASTRADDVLDPSPRSVNPSRPRLKGSSAKAQPIQVVVMQIPEGQPLPPGTVIGGPTGVVPPVIGDPVAGTPVIGISEPDGVGGGCANCPPTLSQRAFPRLASPRPALDCSGCSSLRCQLRFMFGSCRSFFGESQFRPLYPENCPCEKP